MYEQNNLLLSSNAMQYPYNAYTASLNIPNYSNGLGRGLNLALGNDIPILKTMQFDCEKELNNIQNILKQDFSEHIRHRKTIPNKSEIKINQGVNIDCACLIVDMRKSSDLTNYHRKPKLAKLYQTFISNTIMILQEQNCNYINIVGDGVQGFFNTNCSKYPEKILTTAAEINSYTKVINQEFIKNDIVPITIGIGISAGSVLMTKVGRGLHTDIVWIGDVVNTASNLCDIANKDLQIIVISNEFYNVISENDKNYFEYDYSNNCFHSNLECPKIEKYVNLGFEY